MPDKTTFKIVIHNPDKVDLNNDILDEKSTMYETFKDFKSRSDAKQWLADYIQVVEMIN